MFSQKIRYMLFFILMVCFSRDLTADPTWTQLNPALLPSGRRDAAMAFDQASGQMILFGGLSNVNLNDTWAWDGTTWTQLSPANSPPPRSEASMAYDQTTGQLILFGGQNGGPALNDTWGWDGTTWTNLTPSNPADSPPGRVVAALSYDPATGQLILFGGTDFTNLLGDTWNWNGTIWTNVTPSNPANSPSDRYGPSMAFDQASGQLTLFGGYDGTYQNDTWTWDGTIWTQLTPATSPTPGRLTAMMDYDAATGQMILFGGRSTGSGGYLGDTWSWDGTTWTQLHPFQSPSPRTEGVMAFDPATGQMILFGGFTSTGTLDDMWNWGIRCPVAPEWTELEPAASPPDRSGAVMAFDQATGQQILFGGSNISSIFNDTWNWDGTTWTNLTPSTPANSPTVRRQASMAFDASTGQLILFGGIGSSGFFNDTWNWDGTIWTQLSPSNSPSARTFGAFYFDAGTGQMILFGGNDSSSFLGDTWIWDGTNWTQLSPASPPPRTLASMAFDPATGQLILFGGLNSSGYLNETWNWDGTNWNQLSPANSPSPRGGASMDYDQATGQLILFGGQDSSGKFNDTWNWDGTNWVPAASTVSPTARSQAAMTFDHGTGQLILFGGLNSNNQTLDDTWNWASVSGAPIATATPPNQTICSGNATSIALSSTVLGSTFSWTVVENGVTGASSGSGSSIAQTIETIALAAGTATYTVTPTSPTGCVGDPTTVVVTVNPLPNLMATPVSQTICSGGTATIDLSSSLSGTTFSWTVVQTGVTGASAGSGNTISQTLTATNTGTGNALYTITPTSADGCVGATINAIVFVQPMTVATATPSSQTICSGSTTSIALSANVSLTSFSWTVVENGVTGASNGSGPTITQTLTATSSATGTATYTVTPEVLGCPGDPITVVVTVDTNCQKPEPPRDFHGIFNGCGCCSKKRATIGLFWFHSQDPTVVGYHLYENGVLIKTLPVNKTHVSLRRRACHTSYTYLLTAFNAGGAESDPVELTLFTGDKERHRCSLEKG